MSESPIDLDEKGRLRLRTLGAVRLHRTTPDDEPEEVLGPGKPLSVVVYLTCSPGTSATRDHLIDLLWANLDLDGARHALRQTLWYLRKHLGEDALWTKGEKVGLGIPIPSDREQFLEAVGEEDYERAVELYRGDFLPMFAAPGGADFERWAHLERNRLRTQFFRAAETLVRECLGAGEFSRAKELATRARDLDEDNESAWRLVLETFLAAGDEAGARIEAHALESHLEELDRPFEPATERLIELAEEKRARRDRRTPRRRHLEPELVGREREFATVLSAWQDVRSGTAAHVRLTGEAGLGKSRLLEEARVRLEAIGAHPVTAAATQGEQDVSYSLASQIAVGLAQLPGSEDVSEGTAGILVSLNPTLSDAFGVSPERPSTGEVRRHYLVALEELTTAVAEREPLALLVDDLQWSDPQSLRLLESLLHRLDHQRVLLVTTSRPGTGNGLETSWTQTVSLEPLSEEETATLIASLGTLPEETWAEAFPERLRQATVGSPLLELETLRLGLEQGWLELEAGEWRCPDPDRLTAELTRGGILRRRVTDLPEPREELLLLLSASDGEPLSSSVIAGAAEMAEDSAVRHLRAMEVRGLVTRRRRGWEAAHAEIASVTSEVAGRDRARGAHVSIGRYLARTADGDPDRLLRACRHLHRGGRLEELEEVFPRWVAAARERGDRRPPERMARDVVGGSEGDSLTDRLALSVPLRIRIGLTSGRSIAAAGAGIVGILVLAMGLLFSESVPADANLMVRHPVEGAGFAAYEVAVRREGWEKLTKIDVREAGEPIPQLSQVPASHPAPPRPHGEGWAYTRAVADSGGLDVFLVSGKGEERRLTKASGDDVAMDWSPDGRLLLIQTCRWSARCWHDLAVVDPETGEMRRLTWSEIPEAKGFWSPDGTRIAYYRRRHVAENSSAHSESGGAGPEQELCWVTADGRHGRCLDRRFRGDLVGWSDPLHVLAVFHDYRDGGLVEVGLDDGEIRMIDGRAVDARASPDGQWLAISRRGEGATPGWYVCPADRPDLTVPVLGPPAFESSASLSWGSASNRRYVDSLEIRSPRAVPLRAGTRLSAAGFDSRGRPISPAVLTWRSSDTAVASIEREGDLLVPRAPGRVTVRASAGGWREDSAELVIRPSTYRKVLEEEWKRPLREHWMPFGEPRPTRVGWPSGGQALWHHGDGTFTSGVYSTAGWPIDSTGLGLEARLSVRRTKPTEQSVAVGLTAWTNPESVEAWDHRTGGYPLGSQSCSFRFPAGDGRENDHRATVAGRGKIPVDSTYAGGTPFTVTLQIFPDGTCGVAVDGEPVSRSTERFPPHVPYRVLIRGKSADTRILVGHLKVWKGIRGNLDWREAG